MLVSPSISDIVNVQTAYTKPAQSPETRMLQMVPTHVFPGVNILDHTYNNQPCAMDLQLTAISKKVGGKHKGHKGIHDNVDPQVLNSTQSRHLIMMANIKMMMAVVMLAEIQNCTSLHIVL